MNSPTQLGTIIQTKSGWRLRYRLNGVHKSIDLGSSAMSLDQAEKAANRVRKSMLGPKGAVTMADLIEKFECKAMPPNKSTAHAYRSFMKRIEMEWGHIAVTEFSSHLMDIEAWLNGLTLLGRDRSRVTSQPASPAYKVQLKTMLMMLLDKAMFWQIIPIFRNPMELVKVRQGTHRKKEIVTVTPAQYRALLNDPELPQLVKVMIQVEAGLGLRVSETLGLKWTDFDFEQRTVNIQRSVVGGIADKTKTESSAKVLPLHDSLIGVLRDWRMRGKPVGDWVFGSRYGKPYSRDYLRSVYLIPAGKRAGIGNLGWHQFRHSYRARLREVGASLESQKLLMRHSRISTTMDVYGGDESVEALRPVNAAVIERLEGIA